MKAIVVLGLIGTVVAIEGTNFGRFPSSEHDGIREDCEETTSLSEGPTSSGHSPHSIPTAYGYSDTSLVTSKTSEAFASTTTTTTTMSPPAHESQISSSLAPSPSAMSSLRSTAIPYANHTRPAPDTFPGKTSLSFFSTITIKTTVYTTVCPTTAVHVSNGSSYTSTHMSTTTVFSTYHVTMPCAECDSEPASDRVPITTKPPYPAGNSTVPYLRTSPSGFKSTTSTLPYSEISNGGSSVGPFDALAAIFMGIAMML